MGNLTINGSTLATGGSYNKVTVRGDATIRGDVHCNKWKVFGNADVNGNISARVLNVFGQATIRGNVELETAKFFGELSILGNAHAHHSHLRGDVKIDGNMTGETIRGFGYLNIIGDCEADTFSYKGTVDIAKAINAEQVHLILHFADSRVSEIVGNKIRIRAGKWTMFNILERLKRGPNSLVSETIEGDEIYLENTRAKVVRGGRIVIGSGCEIELIEYQSILEESGNSIVKVRRKI